MLRSSKPDYEKVKRAHRVLKTISHPLRLKMLAFIDRNEEVNVNKIYKTLKIEQSITSQHLRLLRDAGIVRSKRSGKEVNYSIDYERLNSVIEVTRNF